MNQISWVKNRLATISTNSLRYRFATILFSENKIANSKACTFYWVLLPTTTIAVVVFGALLAIIVSISWLFGYTPTFFKDKGLSPNQPFSTNYTEPGNSKSAAYRYKYHPRSGKASRFAPWQFLLPLLVAGILVFNIGIFAQITEFFVTTRYIWLAIALAFASFYALGKLFIRHYNKISSRWNNICPPLVVEQETEAVS